MTRILRLLGGVNSPATTTASPPPAAAATVDSDYVVILAALLCAIICVLGLVAVARCAWIRRLAGGGSSGASGESRIRNSHANKGLKKKILRTLPRETFKSESTAKFSDCAICLTEFADGDEIRLLPQCGHGFHVACIDTWLGSNSSCPSCRQILVVARCQKCGGFPASSSSSSGPGGGGGAAETGEAVSKAREDDPTSFLP